jgi:hypothetical protein
MALHIDDLPPVYLRVAVPDESPPDYENVYACKARVRGLTDLGDKEVSFVCQRDPTFRVFGAAGSKFLK